MQQHQRAPPCSHLKSCSHEATSLIALFFVRGIQEFFGDGIEIALIHLKQAEYTVNVRGKC